MLNKKMIILSILMISILIVVLTIISYIVNGFIKPFNHNYILDTEKLGHFGDFIGGFLGVFLTIIATILIYLTYFSQKEELKLSRELFQKQNFESTFFNMLKVHQDLKAGLILKDRFFTDAEVLKSDVKGILIIENFRDELNNNWNKISQVIDEAKQREWLETKGNKFIERIDYTLKDHLDEIEEKYKETNKKYSRYLSNYLRNIYHIIDFISNEEENEIKNNSCINEKNNIKLKYKKYADIFQSQLTNSELFLIFYNSLEFPKLKELVGKYDFVENLHVSNLLDVEHAKIEGIGKIKND